MGEEERKDRNQVEDQQEAQDIDLPDETAEHVKGGMVSPDKQAQFKQK